MNGRSARGLLVVVSAVGVVLATGNLARAEFFEFQKLLASDGATNDLFGRSVSIWGERAIVGAHYDDSTRGSAHLYHTPEPSGLVALVGLGLMGCAGHLWRRRKRRT